jgi:hypothetical protein
VPRQDHKGVAVRLGELEPIVGNEVIRDVQDRLHGEMEVPFRQVVGVWVALKHIARNGRKLL